jgi:Phage integrase family
VTKHFNELVAASGLPPIRLHDLRHGAATLALEAGVDIKVVQEDLGHSSSALTRDTYTSVSPRLAKAEADRTAATIPRAAGALSDDRGTGTDGLPLVSHGRQNNQERLSELERRPGQYGCAARDSNPEPAD